MVGVVYITWDEGDMTEGVRIVMALGGRITIISDHMPPEVQRYTQCTLVPDTEQDVTIQTISSKALRSRSVNEDTHVIVASCTSKADTGGYTYRFLEPADEETIHRFKTGRTRHAIFARQNYGYK